MFGVCSTPLKVVFVKKQEGLFSRFYRVVVEALERGGLYYRCFPSVRLEKGLRGTSSSALIEKHHTFGLSSILLIGSVSS